MTRAPILEVLEEVEFHYPEDPRHLYRIPAGVLLHPTQAWCIAGVSGSGKTTLMTLLAALRPFGRGLIRYRFSGDRPVDVSAGNWSSVVGPDLWRRIGFAFQRPELIRSLSVSGNLELAAGHEQARLFEPEEWGRIAASSVWRISGGQTQRLGLMRAFGEGQELIFLDEPTNNLDVSNRLKVTEFVKEQRPGRALVVVSHDVPFLAGIEDRQVLQVQQRQERGGRVVRELAPASKPRAVPRPARRPLPSTSPTQTPSQRGDSP